MDGVVGEGSVDVVASDSDKEEKVSKPLKHANSCTS